MSDLKKQVSKYLHDRLSPAAPKDEYEVEAEYIQKLYEGQRELALREVLQAITDMDEGMYPRKVSRGDIVKWVKWELGEGDR